MQGAANAFRLEKDPADSGHEQQAAAAVAAPVAPKHGKANHRNRPPERKVSINRSIFRFRYCGAGRP
jgi:hypothetical protein